MKQEAIKTIEKNKAKLVEDDGGRRYVDAQGNAVKRSVTGMLEKVGAYRFASFDPEAAERGSVVHTLLHYLDEGDLNPASIDPELQGYVRAYVVAKEHIRKQYGEIEWVAIEEALFSSPYNTKSMRWGGRPDRIAMIGGKLHVIDIKTISGKATTSGRNWRLQTWGYVEMLNVPKPNAVVRMAIVLRDDGWFALDVANEPKQHIADRTAWAGVVALNRWMEEYR